MNGAQALIRTLVAGGVTTCFTNPGTSEMHFVAALDSVSEMRGVLTLFEGVATGAADGYARMTGTPAATLLHLGPGLGNGIANLHNARRAHTPIVNIVGDHATDHLRFDAPLTSDIETLARNVSPGWIRTAHSTAEIGRDAAEAIAAALGPPGQVATLILPADVSWTEGGEPEMPASDAARADPAPERTITAIASALKSEHPAALLLGGRALREPGLLAAGKIAAATGARLLCEVFPARLERGAGLPALERLAYVPEFATTQLAGLRHLIVVDTHSPASFFAYPGRRSDLVPDGCEVHRIADADILESLEAVVDRLGAGATRPALQPPKRPERPSGALTAESVCAAIGSVLPAGAIVSDESQTSGFGLGAATAGAPRHDLLALTGGAIGQGLPVAVGAAIAAPGRPVLALQADGSSLYTIQSLWTMAREQLDVTVVLFNNRSYGILNVELQRVGATAGPKAKAQLDLGNPSIDFVAIGNGLGVPSRRIDSAEELIPGLERAIAEPGPHLIEVVIPALYSPLQLKVMPYALKAIEAMPPTLGRAVKRRVAP